MSEELQLTHEKPKQRRGKPGHQYELIESPLPASAFTEKLPWVRLAKHFSPYQVALEALAREMRVDGRDPVLAYPRSCKSSVRNAAKRMGFKVKFAHHPDGRVLVKIVEAPE